MGVGAQTIVRISVLSVIPTPLFFDPALPWTPSRSRRPNRVDCRLSSHTDATLELKNSLMGRRFEDACRQFKQDGDSREAIFEFERRTFVHFAVDTESALMTTSLGSATTYFFPFKKRSAGAVGNETDLAGPDLTMHIGSQ